MLAASRAVSGFAFSGRLAIPICVTRPRGFAFATADVFAFSGFDGRVAPDAAESASWRTSNCHGQYLSTDKINRASPDAPNTTKVLPATFGVAWPTTSSQKRSIASPRRLRRQRISGEIDGSNVGSCKPLPTRLPDSHTIPLRTDRV